MGLEPTTFCMASRRSSQLSYIRAGANYSRRFTPLLLGAIVARRCGVSFWPGSPRRARRLRRARCTGSTHATPPLQVRVQVRHQGRARHAAAGKGLQAQAKAETASRPRTDAERDAPARDRGQPRLVHQASLSTAVSPFQPLPGADLRLAVDPPKNTSGLAVIPVRLANVGLKPATDVAGSVDASPGLDVSILLISSTGDAGCSATGLTSQCTLSRMPSDERIAGLIAAGTGRLAPTRSP